uniref:ATP-dependent DNA helicase n=1 Tax=Amphimedon queenslandica TaxID=400682 RepID=A0A1X7TKT1_AMPQE
MRLEDIFGTDKWFGSKNILLVGDLLQLPPVNVRSVFKKISNKLVKTRLEKQMQLTYKKKQNKMN